MTLEEIERRLQLKVIFLRKVKEEEIKWKQKSCCRWLKEGDKNTKFFHVLASATMRGNIIHFLMDGDLQLEDRGSIIQHIKDFFVNLYEREERDRPPLDNLAFSNISEEDASWLERNFEEIEVRAAIVELGGDKAPGPDGFSMAFFQRFWEDTKADVMAFM